MATTFVDYDGNGVATKAFSFPSLAQTDVKVEVDSVLKTASTHYNITSYTTTGGGNVVFTAGNIPATGTNIRIYRDTDIETDTGEYDPQATYSAGSSVKADDLNKNQKQALYAIAEEKDQTIIAQDIKDGAITSAKILDGTIATADIAADAITGAKIADDSINSEHYVDGSIDTAHIADDQITAAKLANTAVTAGSYTATDLTVDAQGRITAASSGTIAGSEIAGDAITQDKIADDAVRTEHLADQAVTTALIADAAVNNSKLGADCISEDKIADDAVREEHLADNAVTTARIAADAINGSKIADDAVDSEHLVDGSIDTAHIGASQVTTAKIADDAITIAKVGCEQTTISDSDSHVPTSGAVVDYVAAQLAPIGGLEVIADDESFPNTIPAAGVVISITDAAGLQVNSSGVSTNADTLDNSTVTINGFPSELRGGVGSNADPYVFQSGAGLMVQSTGSSQTYNYHQAMIRESDFVQLSDDINDFNNRYRVASSAPGSSNDEGDLYFDTSANKMYVYDGSVWGQVTSTGEFKILGVKDNGQAHNGTGPTFNGSNDQYDLFESTSDASITQAAQLIVVLNGVIQKPNDGVFSASGEGFYLDGTDGIRFCDPPPTGSTLFVTKCGSATSIAVPADNSVTAGKTDISLVQGDVIYANGTDSWTRLAKGTAGQVLQMNSGATAPEWGAKTSEEEVEDYVGGMVTGNTETGITVTYQDGDGTLDFVVDDTTKMPLAGGTFTGDVTFDNQSNAGRDIRWDESVDSLEFDDNTKATFGADGDLQIYHDGSHSYIQDTATGELRLRTNTGIIRITKDDTETLAAFNVDGAVELYYDNTKELETKSGGVKLLGHSESVVTALTSASNVTIDFSLSNHFSCTMGHNITFANPTTESVGQSGTIVLTQDGTGSRTASWGSQFLWAGGTAPTLSTAANAVDRIDYFVAAADKIHCVASLDMK